jgi:uncharacterized membrane protein YqjE
MRVLWSLPEAAPVLLRHLAAYADLVAQDLGTARRDWSAQLSAAVVAAGAVFFAVMMGCVGVIASTWDTPHRLTAIAWLGGGFLVVAVLAVVYRSQMLRAQSPFLATVKRDWHEDRVILDRILSPDPE